MKVMIAVDETEESIEAIRCAHALFGSDATYVVASIGEPSIHLTHMDPLGGLFYDVHTVDAPQPAPEAVARRATASAGVDDTVVTDVGPAHIRLCELAGHLAADVLVVGNHERGLLGRLFSAPSVRSYAVDHAPCPVLVARGQTH